MKRAAAVDARGGRLIVSSRCESGRSLVQGDWIEAADEPVEDGRLGTLVRSALAASHSVPWPDFRTGPTPERQRLLELAKVKSEAQYMRGTRHVKVTADDTRPGLAIMPYHNGGRREGFNEMLDQEARIGADADDAAIGAAVRRALAIATDGT
jgi:hypothetical protein